MWKDQPMPRCDKYWTTAELKAVASAAAGVAASALLCQFCAAIFDHVFGRCLIMFLMNVDHVFNDF
jgi:hypothetical protein